MDKTDPLANMHYISINEDVDREIGDFRIRPDVLLPVEIPPGEEEWELSDLSWEAIISLNKFFGRCSLKIGLNFSRYRAGEVRSASGNTISNPMARAPLL